MTLPSKELVEAVLGRKIKRVVKIEQKNFIGILTFNVIRFETDYGDMRSINIYEFAHLVKEYMSDNKIAIIKSSKSANYGWFAESLLTGVVSADTEPEAIIKIAEKILNETKD